MDFQTVVLNAATFDSLLETAVVDRHRNFTTWIPSFPVRAFLTATVGFIRHGFIFSPQITFFPIYLKLHWTGLCAVRQLGAE